MAIILEKKALTPKCDEGLYIAIISDVSEEKGIQTAFGIRDQLKFVFTTNEDVELVWRCTASLSPKSKLVIDLIIPLVGDVTGEQFDVESLVGTRCKILVEHREGQNGGVFANITKILPLKNQPQNKPVVTVDEILAEAEN